MLLPKRLRIPENPPNPADFRTLSATPVARYFEAAPHQAPPAAGITDLIQLPEPEVRRFEADFERLLALKRSLSGLRKASAFREWWRDNRAAYLTRPAVEAYRASDATMGELLEDLHLRFVAQLGAHPRNLRAARWLRNRYATAAALALALVLGKAIGFAWELIVLGPGVQMINSYTQTMITPLAQTAQQQGSRDLGPAAAGIQSWLSSHEKLAAVRRELRETNERVRRCDFSRMPPEQAKARWAAFEKEYFDLFLRYNQTLPSHLRDGRAFLKEWMIFITAGLANNLAVFDMQYWTHRRELEALRARGAHSPRERAELALHGREMEAAQSRIAGALAAWKIYDFMYPEYSQATQMQPLRQAFARSMRFDLYADRFAAAVDELMRQMEMDAPADPPGTVPGGSPTRSPARTSGRTAGPLRPAPAPAAG